MAILIRDDYRRSTLQAWCNPSVDIQTISWSLSHSLSYRLRFEQETYFSTIRLNWKHRYRDHSLRRPRFRSISR